MTQPSTNQSEGVDQTTSTGSDYYETQSSSTVASGVAGVDASSGSTASSYDNGGQGVKDTVTTEAASVAQDAKERGRDVAGTAAEEAKDVAREVKSQLVQLMEQLRGEATTQASDQSRRAARGLLSIGSELNQMASAAPSDGVAGDLVRQAAERVRAAAEWLDTREPGDMLDDVRTFARRRPGTFLAGAAVLGILGGRMTRGLTAEGSPSSSTSSYTGSSARAYPSSSTSSYTGSSAGGYAGSSTSAYPSSSTSQESTWSANGPAPTYGSGDAGTVTGDGPR